MSGVIESICFRRVMGSRYIFTLVLFCALFTGRVNTVLVHAGVFFCGPGAALNAAAQLRSKYGSLVYMGDFCRLNLQYL